MATFNLKSILKGYKKLFGMTAEVYNDNGDLLDSIDLNNSRKGFSFRFDKDAALQGNKNADLTIKLIDNNGDDRNFSSRRGRLFDLEADEQTFTTSISANKKRKRARLQPRAEQLDTQSPVFTSGDTASVDENVDPGTLVYDADSTDASSVSYALSGGDSAAFSIDSQTGQVSINQSPDFESKSSYSFNVVATDARGNASTQAVSVNVNDIEEGKTVALTPLLDNITAADLSNKNDVITAELGTLGFADQSDDSIVDGSTTDNDLLVVKTNAQFDIKDSLNDDNITRIQNIETIQVIADNDDVGPNSVDLDNIVNLKKLDIDGTFTDRMELEQWSDTGATEFDFSGITSTQGVELKRFNAGNLNFAGNIVFKGSPGNDRFEGLLGDVTMNGGQGNDMLIGSRQGSSVMEGGSGEDSIDLRNHNAQHTIRLHGQTSETSRDKIFNFQGFLNAEAQALNTFDLIEIDAATFTNYNAGQAVQQRNINNINDTTDLSNTVVTAATLADLEAENFDNNGNGILGFAAEFGTLVYSESGNFSADAQELLNIGDEGGNFVPTRQINVI